jgi:hypothetical protein
VVEAVIASRACGMTIQGRYRNVDPGGPWIATSLRLSQ